MACEVCGGSCSLCPWCATDNCPHYKKILEDSETIFLYVINYKNSTCHYIAKNKDLQAIVDKLFKFISNKKNFEKRFIRNERLEFIIADGKCNWRTSLSLVYTLNDNKFHKYYPVSDTAEEQEWDGKVIFGEENNKKYGSR